MSVESTQVAICGGGLVGATLAIALAELDLEVTLVESHPFGVSDQPSFDERTTALSNGSRRVFEGLGLWAAMQREATPIRRIHVSDKGRFGFARIDAQEQGLEQLGHVVVNRTMGAALWQRLQSSRVRIIAPARVIGSELRERHRSLVAEHNGERIEIEAELVVAADGSRSIVRESAGVGATTWEYAQTAVVTNVLTQRFHDHVAYERFTPSGPIALLPITDGRCGVVWTLTPEAAAEVLTLDDQAFLARLQADFGFRLGRFTRVGARHTYPLALTRAEAHTAERLAVVGNAAQALHPIAGQGFNLGLRDAASLAEVLADARAAATHFDAGDGLLLQRYSAWREDDRREIVRFTDGLVRVFTQPFAPVKLLRDIGLLAFDLLPPAKSALAQLSLGAAGRVPRLARGAPLVNRSPSMSSNLVHR
ncbi:MAG TPA: 2-octaprenyl-6-methoxyphenyl hydroxylase [Steroidobacteraceae bacterium]|mgnify:FL=1